MIVSYALLVIEEAIPSTFKKAEISSESAIDKLKKNLSSEFEMKDLDEAKKILGMEIERDRKCGKVSLTQKGYLNKVL